MGFIAKILLSILFASLPIIIYEIINNKKQETNHQSNPNSISGSIQFLIFGLPITVASFFIIKNSSMFWGIVVMMIGFFLLKIAYSSFIEYLNSKKEKK